jgi:HPt (histidine-containing phosphotransfer) domain-containing protein
MLRGRWPARWHAALNDGVSVSTSSATVPPQPPTPHDEPVTVLDVEALRRLRELDPKGANHLLERVFQAFEASTVRLLPQLHAAHRAADHAGVRHVVHTLKSSSASIGAIKLSQLCAEIESMIRLGTLDGLTARVERIDRETAAVLLALKQVQGSAA